MRGSAKNFIENRKSKPEIVFSRIREILSYIIYCYTKLSDDSPTYSQSWVKNNTAFHFEDYLKMEFVDSYLIPNKHILRAKISLLEQVNFSYETQKRFTDAEGIQRIDKIDIFINKLGLQNIWDTADENVYFAVECKRINNLSDNGEYLQDIEKFCNRMYLHMRIPFEGMIGFMENPSLSSQAIVDDLNDRLTKSKTIKTSDFLYPSKLQNDFSSSFWSKHFKNSSGSPLVIGHLYFDYSKLIED